MCVAHRLHYYNLTLNSIYELNYLCTYERYDRLCTSLYNTKRQGSKPKVALARHSLVHLCSVATCRYLIVRCWIESADWKLASAIT